MPTWSQAVMAMLGAEPCLSARMVLMPLLPCRGVSKGDLEEELFIAPLAVPKAPERFYYKFGRPVRTAREDQNDPERVQQLYQEVWGVLAWELRHCQNRLPVMR